MKRNLSVLFSALTFCIAAHASTSSYSVNNIFATIPDGDLNGYQNTLTVSGFSGNLADVNVTLNISGGFNGDLYGFLYHNSTTAILLNRVGRSSTSSVGYPDSGFGPDLSANSFTLDDQATHDIHTYRAISFTLNGSAQLSGEWQPDGRNLDPLSSGSAFDSAARSNLLGVFNGMDANGSWTLFLTDVSSGGESTLVSWGLQLTHVPEPGIAMFSLSGIMSGLVWLQVRRRLCV